MILAPLKNPKFSEADPLKNFLVKAEKDFSARIKSASFSALSARSAGNSSILSSLGKSSGTARLQDRTTVSMLCGPGACHHDS